MQWNYNHSIEKWLEDSNIKMYARDNEINSVVAKSFIRTLKK